MNDIRFDLNLLLVFDALLTERSVTRAAQQIGLSQPAFSNALARLRLAVGDPLFERRNSVMSPTPRAVEMAAPVQAALASARQALRRPSESGSDSPIVTVEANDYARYLVLPAAVPLLRKRAPFVRLDIRDLSSGSSALAPNLIIDWARVDAREHSTVILRDVLVGVVAQGVRRRSVKSVVGDATAHKTRDYLSALCLASEATSIAHVPRRLAAQFSSALRLRVFKLRASQHLQLQLAWQERYESVKAVAMVKNCIVEAAHRLARRRPS